MMNKSIVLLSLLCLANFSCSQHCSFGINESLRLIDQHYSEVLEFQADYDAGHFHINMATSVELVGHETEFKMIAANISYILYSEMKRLNEGLECQLPLDYNISLTAPDGTINYRYTSSIISQIVAIKPVSDSFLTQFSSNRVNAAMSNLDLPKMEIDSTDFANDLQNVREQFGQINARSFEGFQISKDQKSVLLTYACYFNEKMIYAEFGFILDNKGEQIRIVSIDM